MSVRNLPCRFFFFLLFSLVIGSLIAPHATRGDDKPATPATNNKPAESKPSVADAEQAKTSKDATRDEEYYELLKLFADTLDQVDRNYVKDISRRELMEAAIRGMVSKLDQYSNYIPPTEVESFKGSVENEFGGVGIQIGMRNGRLTVMSPLVGTPAYKAGLASGDWITEIDGHTTKELSIDDAVKRLKGKAGTEVKVTYSRIGYEQPTTVTLKRDVIRVETILGDRRNEMDGWEYMFDAEKKIAYLRITAFGRHTTEELVKVMADLITRDMKGLIIDLRFNPGGLLSSAIEVSDLFIADGKIVSTAGRNVVERTVNAVKEGTLEGFPIAILVNRYSASASEIVSACLQDHNRAVVIGERTWGKGSVQNIIELEEGKSALKLTTAGYQRPNGKNIHRFEGATEKDDWGVRPNDGFEIRLTDDELRQLIEDRRERDLLRKEKPNQERPTPFVDRQFQKAVEYVTSKLNPAPATP